MSTPAPPDAGGPSVTPAASEPDESQAAPAPAEEGAPPDPNDFGSLVDRYKSAGLDLSAMDPVTLARAHGIAQKVGNEAYYTESQMPDVFQEGMRRLASTPEGKQLLQSYLGGQSEPAPSAGVADGDDPYESRFKSVEGQIQQLVQLGQQLMGQQQQFGRERRADRQLTDLTDHFSQAVSSVAGASESPLLEELFWSIVPTMPEEMRNAQGVKAWVASKLGAEQKARSKRKPRTPPVRSGGGVVTSKKLEDMTPDEYQKALEESLPE